MDRHIQRSLNSQVRQARRCWRRTVDDQDLVDGQRLDGSRVRPSGRAERVSAGLGKADGGHPLVCTSLAP